MSSFQLFSTAQVESLRRGGAILRACLEEVAEAVQPGVTTAALDQLAEESIRSRGAIPGFKGYQGFPATLCTSVNEECVHGIPGARVLEEGDIVSLDCGVLLDGLYTDAALTVPVGAISPLARKLLTVTKRALDAAIVLTRKGTRIGDISALIEQTVREQGFHPVHSLTGHGLGTTLHQFPDVPNEGQAGTGPTLPRGTLIAIEPIVSAGSPDILESRDGWTLRTADGSIAAHFEHTVFVTEDECEIIA